MAAFLFFLMNFIAYSWNEQHFLPTANAVLHIPS